MQIYFEKEDKLVNKKFSGSAEELLKKLRVNPETVIIVRNDAVVTERENLKNSDKIKLLSVVSGG